MDIHGFPLNDSVLPGYYQPVAEQVQLHGHSYWCLLGHPGHCVSLCHITRIPDLVQERTLGTIPVWFLFWRKSLEMDRELLSLPKELEVRTSGVSWQGVCTFCVQVLSF